MPAKLRLGTVQFGQDYGILGQKKPTLKDSVACLDYATQNGIYSIDTAEAYGNAQEVVGEFLKKKTISRERLNISTKLLPNVLDDISPLKYREVIEDHLKTSLRILHTDYVDAYLLHSARYAFEEDMLEALHSIKNKGIAKKVGVSVYEPSEVFACFKNDNVEFVQFPYSVFDHRMKEQGVFEEVLKSSCEIDVRSAFIQGLVLLEENQVPEFLSEAKPIITRLKKVSNVTGYSRIALAMAYIKRESAISHLVFGVDSKEQLIEDIELFNMEVPIEIMELLDKEFSGIKAEIIMPSLWKK